LSRRLLGLAALAAAIGPLGACSSSNARGASSGSSGSGSGSSSSSGASGSGASGGTSSSGASSGSDAGGASSDAAGPQDSGATTTDAGEPGDASEAGPQDSGGEAGGDASDSSASSDSLDANSVGEDGGAGADSSSSGATNTPDSGRDAGLDGSTALSLYGTEVAFSVHCCTAPPNASNLASTTLTATVGPGVEFPAIAATGPSVIDANIDIATTSLSIEYLSGAQAFPGLFNGYAFAFSSIPDSGTTSPVIIGAVLDRATTISGVTVTFDSSDVFVNVAGLSIPAQSTIIVDLTLGE